MHFKSSCILVICQANKETKSFGELDLFINSKLNIAIELTTEEDIVFNNVNFFYDGTYNLNEDTDKSFKLITLENIK